MRAFSCLLILFAALVLFGCSDGGSDSPADNEAHPDGWIALHGTEALKTRDFADCAVCHGADLRGSGAVPSCYSVSFNGQACHAGGPNIPHPLDGSYLSGSAHGPQAKQDLTVCQSCHGQPGGPGSNPRFNLGIAEAGGQGCESCHGVNLAHPANWAGPNNTFHYSAGNIQNACTLCHGLDLDAVGGVGVSCLGCHAEATNFTLDCNACHGYPPDGSPDRDVPTGVNHRTVAAVAPHDVCVVCHGMKENGTGGFFSAVPGYALFDKSTDTLGDHWNGRVNMNAETAYNSTNFGCDAALCHGNEAAYRLSDSGLPVAFGNYGGTVVPHPVGAAFLDPANHGPAAKGLTAAFPNGLLDCQPCHASSATTPPRFDVGIVSAGGNGCEGCHNDRTAHPSAGVREDQPWYNGAYRHANAQGFTTQCALCHGASLEGVTGISPACTFCHVASPVTYSAGCLSCHNLPPNGSAPAGNVRPNRNGEHDEGGHVALTCATCHSGFTYRTPGHFDFTAPASVQFNLTTPDTMTFDAASSTCTGTCHGETHSGASWY